MLVEGRLSIRSYDDTKLKDDQGQPIRRTATEVVINTMQMLSSRGSEGGEGGGHNGGSRAPAAVGAGARTADAVGDDLDDEIPF